MHPPILSHFNPPALSEQLKWRTNKVRSTILRANCNTQFAQTTPELTDFRNVTAGLVDGMDDGILSESFQKTVQFTTYSSYAPFIAKLLERPCKASTIVDLLSPGLPDSLCESSSTSGGLPKTMPKYNCLSTIKSSGSNSWAVSDPLRRRTKAWIHYLGCEPVNVEDEKNCVVSTIYLTCGSALSLRIASNLDPKKDAEKMGTFVLDHAAPYAAGFIEKWRSFLLVHALFALGSKSLETMEMVFINTFVDMIRHLDMQFDIMVDCIANGTIPELDGIAEVRHFLESNISPDPERAAELRRVGRPSSRPGWCGLVWPSLSSVSTIASGSFAPSVPLARWFLGPNTKIHAIGYYSTEASIGLPYNSYELNLFKINSELLVEFLDISKNDSIDALAQPWEVESGRRYEVVVTTHDGLWRYRLGDVVEISGFDPVDGVPIVQFIERRKDVVAMRLPAFMVTEKELGTVLSSVFSNILTEVVDWTTTTDDQLVPATIGFFVELAGDHASDLSPVPDRMLDELSRLNQNVAWAIAHDCIRKPTVWLVRPGTFSDFRQLKLDEGSKNVGQVKVPVVLPKASYVTWFSNRVAQEL